jgi:ribosomal protein L44E
MSKNVIEFCENCRTDTPHKIKHHWVWSNKSRVEITNPMRCLTCGYMPLKAQKTKTNKHISLK